MINPVREFPKFIIEEKKIVVSETFYSIQGEGRYIGTPSVFLRTQGCLLNCLWCDTYEVWKSGKGYSFVELYDLWKKRGYIDKIKNGAHLILTGGEPLARQKEIMEFLQYVKVKENKFFHNLNIEIETAGTVIPSYAWYDLHSHYNVSPKLANSGMDMERRNKKEPMSYFSDLSWENRMSKSTVSFKFVVSDRQDVDEILKTYIIPYEINVNSVYIMAEAKTRKELQEREPLIVDIAKEYGLKYSTRLHLHIWDKATGV
jgi:6-pyruvoyltetrahydropterin 2'-reductase